MYRTLYSAAILLTTLSATIANAQVTGGQRVFEYLRLPNAPHISALGGMNVANPERDIAFALQNPALMRPELHNHLGLSYNSYYAGISILNLNYGYHVPKLETSFSLGIQYLNYGKLTQTDPIGNIYGDFKANDFAITLGASRSYKTSWRYGAALKFANSTLYDKSAAALLADVGVAYHDTASLWTVGVVAKNMGFMMKRYNPDKTAEPLPFDLQIGISKRFKHIPLRLMTTIHHLYEWDIRYDNAADNEQSNIFGQDSAGTEEKSYFADKLFRHFIFGAELTLAKRITISASYNHLRRSELVIQDRTGVAGFAFGAGIHLNKFHVYYTRSYYHIAGAYNEFGLNMELNKLLGIGKTGDKIHWNASYPENGWGLDY